MGRPSKGLTDQAKAQLVPQLNVYEFSSYTAYGRDQLTFYCSCKCRKHAKQLQCQSMTRKKDAFECHIHAGKGSSYERDFYAVTDAEPSLALYAVEATATNKKITAAVPGRRGRIYLNKKRWDFKALTPANLLIEIQGEYHTDEDDGRTNNNGDTLPIRKTKDQRYADLAVKQNYTVLWLYPGDEQGRTQRWSKALKQALQYVTAGGKPCHFK